MKRKTITARRERRKGFEKNSKYARKKKLQHQGKYSARSPFRLIEENQY